MEPTRKGIIIMKIVKLVTLIAGIAAFTGCAVTKTPQPTGGSKADGIVELSYEHGSMQSVTLNKEEALVKARERCQSWGYEDAEAFGGQKRQCQSGNAYGCNRWFVTLTYQCLD